MATLFSKMFCSTKHLRQFVHYFSHNQMIYVDATIYIGHLTQHKSSWPFHRPLCNFQGQTCIIFTNFILIFYFTIYMSNIAYLLWCHFLAANYNRELSLSWCKLEKEKGWMHLVERYIELYVLLFLQFILWFYLYLKGVIYLFIV